MPFSYLSANVFLQYFYTTAHPFAKIFRKIHALRCYAIFDKLILDLDKAKLAGQPSGCSRGSTPYKTKFVIKNLVYIILVWLLRRRMQISVTEQKVQYFTEFFRQKSNGKCDGAFNSKRRPLNCRIS